MNETMNISSIELMKQISENIKKYRKERNLTQEQLAEHSELSISFISRLERNSLDNISILKINQIAKALNIPITYIIESKKNNIQSIPNNILMLTNYLLTLEEDKANEISLNTLNLLKSTE